MIEHCPVCGEGLYPKLQQPRTINCHGPCNRLWSKDWDPIKRQNILDENGQALWLDIKPVGNTSQEEPVANAGGRE